MKMKPIKRFLRWCPQFGAGLLAVVLSGGCATEPQAPAALTISPGSAMLLRLDETVQLTATVQDEDGRTISGVAANWISEDESVVTVDAAGLVTAVGKGVALVSATVAVSRATEKCTLLAIEKCTAGTGSRGGSEATGAGTSAWI